jgi:hypothetical protein
MEKTLIDHILDEDFLVREDIDLSKVASINNDEVNTLIKSLEVDPMQKYAETQVQSALDHDMLESLDGPADKTLLFLKLAADRQFKDQEVIDFIIKQATKKYNERIQLIEKEITDVFQTGK